MRKFLAVLDFMFWLGIGAIGLLFFASHKVHQIVIWALEEFSNMTNCDSFGLGLSMIIGIVLMFLAAAFCKEEVTITLP